MTQVQNLSHCHHTFPERLQDLMIHPRQDTAALLSLALFFIIIQAGGMAGGWIDKLFHGPIFINAVSGWLGGGGFFHDILLGDIAAPIDYETAMGVLTTGVYVALGLVFPYVLVFYLVIGFLEDLGYLPRVAILFDRLFHMVGLHGYSILPMMLACGCNVPGVLAIRNLESRRERFITAVITAYHPRMAHRHHLPGRWGPVTCTLILFSGHSFGSYCCTCPPPSRAITLTLNEVPLTAAVPEDAWQN